MFVNVFHTKTSRKIKFLSPNINLKIKGGKFWYFVFCPMAQLSGG